MEMVAQPTRRSWEPGEVVGQYSLLGRIAQGGMAEIWLARQVGLAGFQRVVVIKKISNTFSHEPKFVEMFLDEARIAAQLSHPNVVQIYDLGVRLGSYYITMEYLHGEDLGTVVRHSVKAHSPLPVSQAVRIIASAADGLAYAHDRLGLDGKPLNLVHRDISPHNVVVTYDGGVKLVDFGIAKARSRVSRTQDGTIKGKVHYLSPEQARGDPLDGRSDVFSLGIVLYESIGRCRLFNYEDAYSNLMAITGKGEIPPPSSLNADIPAELDAIALRALARRVEDRFASARHLQIALEDWLRKSSDAPGTVEISGSMRSLFAERMAQRSQMIDSARRGEPPPTNIASALRENPEPQATEMVSDTDPFQQADETALLREVSGTSPEGTALMESAKEISARPTRLLPALELEPKAPPADPGYRVARALEPREKSVEVDPQLKIPTDLDLLPAPARRWIWILSAAAIVSVIAVGCFLWLRGA